MPGARRRASSRALATFAFVVALIPFTGCGDDDSQPSSGDREAEAAIATAVDRTLEAGTARMVTTYEGDMEAVMRQDADFDTDRASGTISFESVPGQPELSGISGQMYSDGPRTYARFPEVTPTWIELNQDLGGGFENQPTALFESLEVALQDVEEVAGDSPPTEYRATYDLEALVEQAPAAAAERAQEQLDAAPTLKELPATITVGRDGLIRRFVLDIRAGGGGIRATVKLSALGSPVQIGPPPASAVEEPGPG